MSDDEIISLSSLDVPPLDEAQLSTDGKPALKLITDAGAIRSLTDVINGGWIPDVYVTNGELTHLSRVSGDVSLAGLTPNDRPPLPVTATTLTSSGLAALAAQYLYVFRERRNRDGDVFPEEMSPKKDTLSAVLSQRYWPGVRPLHGIVGAPVLRPDGTLLQKSGYDLRTGLYYAAKVEMRPVPDKPTPEEVAEARSFLLDRFLGDFPWVSDADRANYIGLLVTQILRPYTRCLTPFGLISATTQSSGKTILSDGIGQLYGQKVQPWVRSDQELRKAVTAILDGPAAVVVFDNIKEGEVIDSPVLAMLLTTPTWSDRLLGTNKTFTAVNDRLWLATGNNLRLGGDMATRTVLVRLDPKMPRPELRTNFTIPHLEQWIKQPENQRLLLRHLLILVMDWITAGAPRTNHVMRQFSVWAAAVGGFLAHHEIDGFLNNGDEVRDLDEEDAQWAAFLDRWHEIFKSEPKEAGQVRKSAEVDYIGNNVVDRWEGDFITDDNGNIPTSKSLGHRLAGQVGRFHGDYVLRDGKNSRDRRVYWVEVYQRDS